MLQYKSMPTDFVEMLGGGSLARRENISGDGISAPTISNMELPHPYADVLFHETNGTLEDCGGKTYHIRCTCPPIMFPSVTPFRFH